MFRRAVSWGRSSNIYLPNGGRLYLAEDGQMEYATPECDELGQLVAHARAGGSILLELARAASERLAVEGFAGRITLGRALSSAVGESHENYLVHRSLADEDIARILVPFLVTRLIYAGAGAVLPSPGGNRFLLSRRAESVWSVEAPTSGTGNPLPLIDRQARSLGEEGRHWRLRVLGADANECEVATFLKVGATALMLRLMEVRPDLARDLRLENAIRAVREVNHLGIDRPLRLAVGRTATALAIQRECLAAVLRLLESEGQQPQERRVVRLWDRTLTRLEGHDARLGRTIDWVAKRQLIEREDMLGQPDAVRLDLAYHALADGVFQRLVDTNAVDRVCRDIDIDDAASVAPATTRAHLRGRFIRAARAKRCAFTVDWTHLKINDQAQRTVVLDDPLDPHDRRAELLLASLDASPPG
jgi:proteasome accessory factor A